jgi:hypothetical protein
VIATAFAALQSGAFAVYPDRGRVRGLARRAIAQAGGSESEYYDGLYVITDDHPPQPVAEVFMVRRSDGRPSKAAAKKPQRKLPAERPQGIGPLEWRVAGTVLDLQNEGIRWNQVPDLLDLVCKRIAPETAHLATLKNARKYLRAKRLLDR